MEPLTSGDLADLTSEALGHFSYISSGGYKMTALLCPEEEPFFVAAVSVGAIDGMTL